MLKPQDILVQSKKSGPHPVSSYFLFTSGFEIVTGSLPRHPFVQRLDCVGHDELRVCQKPSVMHFSLSRNFNMEIENNGLPSRDDDINTSIHSQAL